MSRATTPSAITPSTDCTADRPPTLLHRAHLPLAAGAVALVTLGAFENRAVMTVLPTAARELDGLWLFGVASGAPLISFVVATTLAGLWSDRRGPVRALAAGMATFLLGELTMGLAPAMPVFVVGRFLGGLAEGLLDVGLTVLVARALPAELRPRIFAAFAAAWVLPSLLGPSVAGIVAERLHWRAVFLLGVVLLVPVVGLLRPAMKASAANAAATATNTVDAPASGGAASNQRRSAGWAVVAATALAALSAGGSLVTRPGPPRLAGAVLLVGGLATLLPSVRVLLPAGTLRAAPGIPALTVLRGLLGVAFGTAGGLMPLMLAEVHGYGPAEAGVSLTITGVFWAAGSQLQSRQVVQERIGVGRQLQVGFALMAGGLVGPTLLSLSLVPPLLGLGLWAVAATGIGICSPVISTQVLALSAEADQGRNSAASVLAPSISQAVAFAATGAAIAWQAPHPTGGLFATIMGASALAAGLAALLATRAG
jgi:hypothetical protein